MLMMEEKIMLSFDYAQNWEIPRFQKQPGEMYFLCKQKVDLFGITDETSDFQHDHQMLNQFTT